MSVSGYSLSKINALLNAREQEMALQRMKSAQQAQQAADMAKLVGQIPGAASDLYSGVGKAMDEEAQRKLRDAMLMAGPGETADQQIDDEYAKIMSEPYAMANAVPEGESPFKGSPPPTDLVGELETEDYIDGMPSGYQKSLGALTGPSTGAMPPSIGSNMGTRSIGQQGTPVSPAVTTPKFRTVEKTVPSVSTKVAGTVTGGIVPGTTKLLDNSTTPTSPKKVTEEDIQNLMSQTGMSYSDAKLFLEGSDQEFLQGVPNEPVQGSEEYNNLIDAMSGKKKVDTSIPTDGIYSPSVIPSAGTVPVPGFGAMPVPLPQTTPEKNAVPEETTDEPSAVQAQKDTEPPSPAEDPDFVAQKSYLDKIQSYSPPKYAKNEKQIARDIIKQVYQQQPQGNPLLNILTLGQYENKMKESEAIAEKMLIKQIRQERSDIQDKHFQDFERQAKLEAQALRLQQQAIDSKRKAELNQQKIGIKIQKPDDALAKLNDYQETDYYLGDVVGAIRQLDKNNESLPAGAAYTIKLASMFAKASTPAQQKAIGANLNAALNAMGAGAAGGGGISISVGSRTVKEDVLRQAAEQIQRAKMSTTQRDLASKLMLAIQVIGKAREGGRMTDSDLRFYLDNLVAMDNTPRAMLNSINYLRKTNARSHNMWLKSFNNIYGPTMFGNRPDITPDFIDEETMARFDKRPYKVPPELAALLDLGPEATLESTAREGAEALKKLPKTSGGGVFPPGYTP